MTPEGLRIVDAIKQLLGRERLADDRRWALDIVDAYIDHRFLTYTDLLSGETREVSGKPISLQQLLLACEALGYDAAQIIEDSRL